MITYSVSTPTLRPKKNTVVLPASGQHCVFAVGVAQLLCVCTNCARAGSTSFSRVMRATVPIPAVASVSVLHAAAVGGSVVGVVGPL